MRPIHNLEKTAKNINFSEIDIVNKQLALILRLFWYINFYNPTSGYDSAIVFIDLTTLSFVKKFPDENRSADLTGTKNRGT